VKRPIDLTRVRAALAHLDAILRRFPHLRLPEHRERLTKALGLDDVRKEGDGGKHGDKEDQQEDGRRR
jgi:hypothetical protein